MLTTKTRTTTTLLALVIITLASACTMDSDSDVSPSETTSNPLTPGIPLTVTTTTSVRDISISVTLSTDDGPVVHRANPGNVVDLFDGACIDGAKKRTTMSAPAGGSICLGEGDGMRCCEEWTKDEVCKNGKWELDGMHAVMGWTCDLSVDLSRIETPH